MECANSYYGCNNVTDGVSYICSICMRKIELQNIINDNEFWLRPEQGMSNPMKIKHRKKALKLAKDELISLN